MHMYIVNLSNISWGLQNIFNTFRIHTAMFGISMQCQMKNCSNSKCKTKFYQSSTSTVPSLLFNYYVADIMQPSQKKMPVKLCTASVFRPTYNINYGLNLYGCKIFVVLRIMHPFLTKQQMQLKCLNGKYKQDSSDKFLLGLFLSIKKIHQR